MPPEAPETPRPQIISGARADPNLPQILMQALLTFDRATGDGQLVAAVGNAWFRILALLRRDPSAAYQMDPRKWEEFIAGAYEQDGYEVVLTPQSQNGGPPSIRERVCSDQALCLLSRAPFNDQAPLLLLLADRTLEAAGQVESAKGEPISPEQILRVMERIEMNFDDDGKNQLSLVIHPSRTEKFAAALRRLEEDPVMRQRHEDLLARKKEAWRVREASRRLVG
jgi:hypothetical protein